MAYTGSGIFDNDDAFDWLDSCTEKNITRKLRLTLKKVINFKVKPIELWSDKKIEDYINIRLNAYKRNGPGNDFYEQDITFEEYLDNFEKRTRPRLKDGSFFIHDHGPVEQALASIGLIAITLGIDIGEIAGSEEEIVEQRAAWLKDYKIKKDLIELAIQALEKILTNETFSKSRRWWLDMDNEQPKSWDHMLPIKELKKDLELKLIDF